MVTTTRIGAGVAALAAVGLLGAGLSGCSVKVETSSGNTPSVSAADLQQNLTDRLTQAGNSPKSVTCKGDLVGEVGKTATCEIVMSEANTFDAVVNVTKVDGTTVTYDAAPQLTKDQLEKVVTGMASAESVACDTGIEGKVGAIANCTITKDGALSQNVVGVSKVEGLMMDLEVN